MGSPNAMHHKMYFSSKSVGTTWFAVDIPESGEADDGAGVSRGRTVA